MEYPPNQTLYINNLNEKVKKEGEEERRQVSLVPCKLWVLKIPTLSFTLLINSARPNSEVGGCK